MAAQATTLISVHAGNDIVYTGTGNDDVRTGAGDDTVYYDGSNLFLSDYDGTGGGSYGGTDVLEMPSGVIALDLSFSRTGNDLIIGVEGRGTITIGDHFSGASYKWETIRFADTSTLDLSTIELTVLGTGSGETLNGGANNDTIYGLGGNDTLNGNGADDKLYGGDDNDTLYGNDGNDRLYGEAGNDYINGGAGNDEIHAGASGTDDIRTGLGNDILFYESGTVTIQESYSAGTSGGTEIIDMDEGIVAEDVTLTRSSAAANDLIITVAGRGTITVAYQFFGSAESFETIRFSDNSTITLTSAAVTTYGTSGNNTLNGITTGGSVNDTLYGLGGNDTLYGAAGNDVLDGGADTDTLYGGAGNDIYYLGDGNDWADEYNQSGTGNDLFIYSGGLDTIYDDDGADILRLSGSTTINDISMVDLGSHNKIVINSGVDEIELRYFDTSSVYKVETIEFADGFSTTLSNWSSWTNGTASGETLNGGSGADTIIGKAGADTLNGNDGADAIHGGADNDTLNGGNGADLLHGGTGNDTVAGGDGLDTLYGGDGADTILFDLDAFNNIDNVKDFNVGQNDVIEFDSVLVGYNPLTDAISDWITFTNSSGNSQMFVDRDGTGGTYSSAQVALLYGVVDLDADDLLTNGNLLVA